MVVTGVNMLLGGRADSGLVRHGVRRARVEGVRAQYRARSCSRPRTVAVSWTTASC